MNKKTVYGIKTSKVNNFQVHTIRVAFNSDFRVESLIKRSLLHSNYIKVVDKNGKDKLVVDFATADINKFSLAVKDFYKISFENALNHLIEESNVRQEDLNRILTSKLVYSV
jgi:hypothetical protein